MSPTCSLVPNETKISKYQEQNVFLFLQELKSKVFMRKKKKVFMRKKKNPIIYWEEEKPLIYEKKEKLNHLLGTRNT